MNTWNNDIRLRFMFNLCCKIFICKFEVLLYVIIGVELLIVVLYFDFIWFYLVNLLTVKLFLNWIETKKAFANLSIRVGSLEISTSNLIFFIYYCVCKYIFIYCTWFESTLLLPYMPSFINHPFANVIL